MEHPPGCRFQGYRRGRGFTKWNNVGRPGGVRKVMGVHCPFFLMCLGGGGGSHRGVTIFLKPCYPILASPLSFSLRNNNHRVVPFTPLPSPYNGVPHAGLSADRHGGDRQRHVPPVRHPHPQPRPGYGHSGAYPQQAGAAAAALPAGLTAGLGGSFRRFSGVFSGIVGCSGGGGGSAGVCPVQILVERRLCCRQ